VPVVVGTRSPEAVRVMREKARRSGARALVIDRDFRASSAGPGFVVELGGERHERLELPLMGAYQADNLACAVAALTLLSKRKFPLSDRSLRKGLTKVRWPGRLELLPGAPDVLFDAAHNPAACEALSAHLASVEKRYRKRVLVFAVMRDKDHATMLGILRKHFTEIVFATPLTPRALPAGELKELYGGHAVDDPVRAFARAEKLAGKRGLVVVAGSIFVMAAVRAARLGLGSDPPIAM
jgi:dihydrofolate synthase/folylpolyglutamate synthase